MTEADVDAIADATVALVKDALAPVLERLAALEAKPSVQDAGAWKSQTTYREGDVVSFRNHAWICRASHTSESDISHGAFRLLVRAGRDGKDLRR